jgi:hypothetical protein
LVLSVVESGGKVLPPTASPHGYSLTDMARATALFTNSGNDLAQYPQTPFQVLFVDWSTLGLEDLGDGGLLFTAGNSFTVASGTPLYVPLLSMNDSPPVIGAFPSNASDTATYFFGQDQTGVRDLEVLVDGHATRLDASYLSELIEVPLLDGGGHVLTVGAFVSPLPVGRHTITIRGALAGAAYQAQYGGYHAFVFTYVVNVVSKPR